MVGLGLSAIGNALFGPKLGAGGANVSFDVKMGDSLPLSFVVGDYATAGKRKYIGSWGKNTRFITEVIEISALPVSGLQRLWINDEPGDAHDGWFAYVNGSTQPGDVTGVTEYQSPQSSGLFLGTPYANMGRSDAPNDARIWVKFINGTQTSADPLLMWAFGGDPDYPWTSSMIGRGKAYVIVTTEYLEESLTSYPTFLWQPEPLALYDWRADSTAGGSGAQRWSNPATWQPTRNPAVIAYNIVRGVYFGSEWVYGGRNLAAWRLPVAEWTAAANACDRPVTLASGATQPRYRCGMEISVDMEPASVLDELGKAANMKFAEVGGRLKPIVDLPGSAVLSISDADILITEGQSFSPFNPVSDTFNAISATYPEPGEKWASKDAPEYIDADARDEDGEYRPTSMSYGAVPYARQVQRLMRSQVRDFRRMRRHQFYLPPAAYALEPGIDMVSWTSQRNGYDSKLFVVESVAKAPGMNVLVSLREVDPSDYDWTSGFERPVIITPPVNPRPFVQTSDGFNVAPSTIADEASNARRPDVLATYVGSEVGVTSIQIRGRVAGRTEIVIDTLRRWNDAQAWRSFNVLPSTTYEFQARLFSDLTPRGAWSPWRSVTTPEVGFTWEDWDAELRDQIEGDLALIPAAIEAAQDARARADAVRSDHDALVEGFVGKLTDLTAADQGIQQRLDLVELSVSNSSYIRKTDGDGPSVGLWDGIGAAADPISSTSVPPGQTGRSVQVAAPGAMEGPVYTGASLNGAIFRIRGWVFVSAGATARAALVNASGGMIAQSGPITGGWQQIDLQFEVGVETSEWSPAWLVTAGGTMRFWRVRLEDYSAAASLEASIAENAQAIIDETAARAAVVGTLTARANSLAGRLLPSDMRNEGEFWTNSLSGSPEAVGDLSSAVQYYTSPAVGAVVRIPVGQATNTHIISKGVTEFTEGRVVRLTVKVANIGGTTDRLRALFVALRSDFSVSRSLGTSRIIRPPAAGQFQTVSLDFTVPAALADEAWLRIGVFASAATSPDLTIDVASIRIDDVTASEGVRGELSGEITTIKGLDVDALEGTAFGVLLEQLEVNAGGTSAKITAQGSAIADLEGNASAGYLIKAQAGGAVSLIDLIAADGSGDTPTSIARVAASEILLEGSVFADQIAVVGVPTLVHDPLYKRMASWVGTGLGSPAETRDAATFGGGVALWGGETLLLLTPANSGAYARVISRKVAVRPGQRIKAQVTMRAFTGGREAGFRVFFYATEAQGAGSPTATATSVFNGTSASERTVEVEVPAGCVWMAMELANRPAATGADTGTAGFGYPELRNMDAANLIVSGGIVADMVTTDTVRAINGRFSSLTAANVRIGTAEIDTINIKGDALYVPYLFTRADVQVPTSNGQGNQLLVFDRTIPDFEGGGFLASFNAYYDSTTSSDAFGAMRLVIDGVQQVVMRFGVRAASDEAKAMFPVNLTGTASGNGATNIKVYVYNSNWANIGSTSASFWMRNLQLTVSGTRR
ncbi:hypothetical protein [Paracoccus sp. ME4]|uniref:hypothetical protein n=1 Tax=Paracoccus sp. ME4 TaxID=3138066 RepID=UPI00398AACA5